MPTKEVVKGVVVTEDDAVELAHKAEERVVKALSRGKDAMWELAEALYGFDDVSGWHRLGHESLEEWLAQPEVGITKSVYYNLVGSWRKLVVHQQIKPARLKQLDPSKVSIVADAVSKARVEVDDALSDVETLGYRDLREKYAKPKKAQVKPKDDKPDEGEDEKPDTTPQEKYVRVEQEPEGNGLTVPSLDDLTRLAGKRWHRKPGAEQVQNWLDENGVALLPDIDWSVLEEAAASGAKNPRIPLNVIQAILDWRAA